MKLFNFVLQSANYKGENFCSFIILITKSIYGTFLPLLIYMTCKSFSNMFHIIQQYIYILLLCNCALASNAVSLPPLWYQSHSFLAVDSVVVFSVSPSVSTRNFGAQLLCPLLTVVGATLVVK